VRVDCVRCEEDSTASTRSLICYLSRALSAAQIDRICARCAESCGTQANAPIGGSRAAAVASDRHAVFQMFRGQWD
jgi:hypothetical protein